MEPIPLCRGQLLFPPQETAAAYAACKADSAAALVADAALCDAVAEAVLAQVPVGLLIDCLPGPAEVSAQEPCPTEALIAQHKDILKQGIPESADFIYLRCTDTFASLRCAVLAVTDLTGRTIMAEVQVAREGMMPHGTDIVAAVGILQRIGVSTIVIAGDSAEDVSDALQKAAPYARLSLGARIDPAWLEDEEFPLPNAEVFLPRQAADSERLAQALRTHTRAAHVPRDHDDFLLAPDGTNPHFLDPYIDISDEIEVGARLSERLIEAEDDAGALKLQLESEEDLIAFEEHVFMIARPVCLCAEQPELLESALRIYPGRALYDGTWPLEERLLKYFSEKYGMIVL